MKHERKPEGLAMLEFLERRMSIENVSLSVFLQESSVFVSTSRRSLGAKAALTVGADLSSSIRLGH